jgi:hypothetical protein
MCPALCLYPFPWLLPDKTSFAQIKISVSENVLKDLENILIAINPMLYKKRTQK